MALLDGSQRATTPAQRRKARTQSAEKAAAKGQDWERKHWLKYTR